MARVLISYGTPEGQTKISAYVAEFTREHGHEAEVADIGMLSGGSPLAGHDAVHG